MKPLITCSAKLSRHFGLAALLEAPLIYAKEASQVIDAQAVLAWGVNLVRLKLSTWHKP